MTASNGQGNIELLATYEYDDPRPFYLCQKRLDYQIPELCGTLVRVIAEELSSGSGITVLDMGCSYGISPAVITCDLALEDVYQNYGHPACAALSVPDLRSANRQWFDRHRRAVAMRMLGFDRSANAVRFASDVGLLDGSWACDLERHEPPPDLVSAMRDVDLGIGIGIFSYITPLTLQRLLAARTGAAPWMLFFPLRMTDYRPVSATLARHGLRTVRLNAHPIFQQRLDSEREQRLIVQDDGTPRLVASKNGYTYYLADCFLSVPENYAGATAGCTSRLERAVDNSTLLCTV